MEDRKASLLERFTYWLTGLKYWAIFALGAASLVTSMLALSVLAHLCYNAFPGVWGWIVSAHILAGIAVAWFVPSPFIDAYLYKKADLAYKAAWRRILDLDNGDVCADVCELGDCDTVCLKGDGKHRA